MRTSREGFLTNFGQRASLSSCAAVESWGPSMRARAVKFASLMSLALVAGAIGADLARSRHGSGVIRAAAKATVELAGGDILSWNLTFAGLLGSPFNLHPPNSVVYLQRSRVSATGSDVTFDYSGIEGADQKSGNSFFDEIHGYRLSGPRQQDKTAPENIFDAAGESASDVRAISLPPAAPKRATAWALMLVGFATLGLIRICLDHTPASV